MAGLVPANILGEPLSNPYRNPIMSTARRIRLLAFALLPVILAGCPDPATKAPGSGAAEPPRPLTLVVVDDPELGKAIAREWLAHTEQEIEVVDVKGQDIVGAHRLPGDIIIFESGLIGELAESELIVPLPDSLLNAADFDRRDIFDRVRLGEMKWGDRTFAVPLGSPQFLLAYRPDVFQELGLAPPQNWTEYQALVEKLADRAALGDLAPAEGEPWQATVEPLADGWAGQLLLARAASAALHREQISPLFEFDTAAALIDKPPYVEALKELAAAAEAGGFTDQKLTPTAAVAEVRGGRAAMAIGWPGTKGAGQAGETGVADQQKIAFALLPGATRTYNFATDEWEDRDPELEERVATLAVAGRFAAVASSSASAKRAEALLVWMAGSEASSAIGPASPATTLFRRSHQQTATRWAAGLPAPAAQQYAQTLAEASALSQTFPGVRLPGREQYLEALDQAVQQALSGDKSAEAALKAAAAAWQATTDRVGVEQQKRAILRSVGEGDAFE